jgi:hypothetical protein
MKELSLETEYCAFMVAIMLVRVVVNPVVNSIFEWAADVAVKLNNLNLTQDYKTQFDVNPLALSHGIKLFVRSMPDLGCSTDKKTGSRTKQLIEAFHDLEASTNEYMIKFNNLPEKLRTNFGDVEPTKQELKKRIKIMKDDILSRNGYVRSVREDLTELKCEMFFFGKDLRTKVKALEGAEVTPEIKNKRSRKDFESLGHVQAKRIGNRILDEVESDYGETHSVAIFDIVTALAQKRAKTSVDLEDIDEEEDAGSNDDSFEVEDGEIMVDFYALEDDEKIKEAIDNLNKKFMIYSLADKMEILNIYDIVFDILTLRKSKGNITWDAARKTEDFIFS